MQIVGLTGKAGSGKSFIAREILAKEGYVPLALAGPMKAELSAQGVIPINEAVGTAPKSERTRRILQVYGTELGRERYHENIWCWALHWWMQWFASEAGMSKFVITDVRFPNEVEFVEELGGLILRVVGRGGLPGAAGQHESEIILDAWDFHEIDNKPGRSFLALKGDVLGAIMAHTDAQAVGHA